MGLSLENIQGKTVLVVEDEALVALDLTLTLQDNGAKVLGPSGSLDDAMKRVDDVLPDGAILDVDLHGISVRPLADRLTQEGVPFVFHSGHADLQGIEKFYENVPVSLKPCEPERIIKRLMDLMTEAETSA